MVLFRRAALCLILSLGFIGLARAESEEIVVETIPVGNTLAAAGVRPGDILRSWERLPSPPANPQPAAGELTSPFDWDWLVIEQSMRGTLRLHGEREGRPFTWTVPLGTLEDAEIRPVLPLETLGAYEHGRDLLKRNAAAEAIDCWRSLAEAFRQQGDRRLASWLLYRSARSSTDLRIWDEAEAFYQEALAVAPDPRSQVTIFEWRIDAYLRQGRFVEAEESCLTWLRLAESTWGESLEAANSRFELGWVLHGEGHMEAAEDCFRQVLAIRRKLAPGSRALSLSLKYLGIVAVDRGDLESAEHDYRAALRLDQQLSPDGISVTGGLNNLGIVYLSRGDLDAAEDFLGRALEKERRSRPEGRSLISILNNLGNVATARSDPATAEPLYLEAERLGERLDPGALEMSQTLYCLGRLAMQQGNLAVAESRFQQAQGILARLAPASIRFAEVLADLGVLRERRGDLDRAESYLRQALALTQQLNLESWLRAEILYRLASVLRKKGAAPQAERELTRAVETLEAQVVQLGGSPEVKGAFRSEEGEIYRDAVRLQVELGSPREAFRLLERFRAQSFLTLLAERDFTFAADLPPERNRERRRLATSYDRNELRLATLDPERDGRVIEALRREQIHLRERREEIDAELHKLSPRLAAMIQPRPLAFEEVQAALDPGTVMLSYSVGKEETQLFVVIPGKDLAVKTLPVGEAALRQEISRLRQLVDQVQARSGLGTEGLDWASRRLYRLLVQPAEPWIEAGRRIMIVPDGPLHLLPFAALIRESGQYLVEWKPLHTALSGTVYAELKERRGSASVAASVQWVGFGDPWFPPRLATGRAPEIRETRLRSAATRGALRWERLPESRREVERIANLFPPEARKVYVDREATEEKAKALGREARIVHFATHGFVDDRSPFDSGLVLAIPEQFAEGHDNGLLQVWEIFESVRLDADLVVLSACETGLGEIRGGEGIIGLTRAFQFAGARSVLASLWRVDDRATAELMERFYRHLRGGERKDEALRAAQLELIGGPGGPRMGSAAAPYFWASMQLYGDWQ